MMNVLHRIVYTTALAVAACAASAQNRLETPSADLQQGLHDHENIIKVEMERLRLEREYQLKQEADFNALDADAKKALVDADFAAAWAKTSSWKLKSTDEFLPKALANYRVEFSGERAVVKNAQGKVIARVGKGERVPVEHPDVSSYLLEVVAVDADAKAIKLSVGDLVYTLHADGKVDESTPEELLGRLKEKLAAYDSGQVAHSFTPTVPTVTTTMMVLGAETKESLRLSHLIGEKNLEYRVTARPLEFALTLFCIARGEEDGRAMVWEKTARGYYLRPFPIGENLFEHDLPQMKLKSIAEDSSLAVIEIDGKESTLAPLDFVQVPLGGKTYIDGIVESVSTNWHEVVIDAGGKKLAVAMLPADVAARPINGKTRDDVRVRMLCRYMSSLTGGVTITPGSVVMETGGFTGGENITFAEVWANFLSPHEWSYRWIGEGEILLDYPEFLVTPQIEAKRLGTK